MSGACRAAAALAATAVLVGGLAGCGDDAGGAPSEARTAAGGEVFDDADVAFASGMIQHHAQALSMVDLTGGRPLDPAVERLAETIRAAQAPEIETMSDWLTAWGEEVPPTMRDHSHAGHDAGGDLSEQMAGMDTAMPGMVSAAEMDGLQDATDAEFQTRWLTMMVAHHEGAVAMARAEQDDGRSADAVALAATIASAQAKEIERMEQLLG